MSLVDKLIINLLNKKKLFFLFIYIIDYNTEYIIIIYKSLISRNLRKSIFRII